MSKFDDSGLYIGSGPKPTTSRRDNWTPALDSRLRSLVTFHGAYSWTVISADIIKHAHKRVWFSPEQCEKRWRTLNDAASLASTPINPLGFQPAGMPLPSPGASSWTSSSRTPPVNDVRPSDPPLPTPAQLVGLAAGPPSPDETPSWWNAERDAAFVELVRARSEDPNHTTFDWKAIAMALAWKPVAKGKLMKADKCKNRWRKLKAGWNWKERESTATSFTDSQLSAASLPSSASTPAPQPSPPS
ncbi:hypothetical protein MNV49_003330 [Pseudohyphozyma bogoriensis]|nr:hypothetical protein MNV49_003330 [Pseudohyphozyma bogoriensis]